MNNNLRILVAVCLVATAVLSATWTLLAPEFSSDSEEFLRAVADGGTSARVSVFGFAVSQLPFLIGVAGVAAWLHPASPRLAVAGGALAVLGGFGHAVFSGAAMTQVLMSSDPTGYADLAGSLESFGLLVPFMAAGLLGTVLGLILLGVAHFRSAATPRWVGPTLWAFVIVEFAGSGVSEWASYLAALLYLAALSALALGVAQRESAVAADHLDLV
ncbi:MAG: hypothetical protein WB508_11845 [Aeromicrobium sp.]|uniref:hypothetical protein n=1 Tax=Aeromicrobium sp. TaxID=1871063 RepID=UPI003C5CAF81